MLEVIMVLISFGVGLFAIHCLRGFDVHEKEPFLIMGLVTIWGGAWSIGIALGLYEYIGYVDIQNSFGRILTIGPIEEAAKLIALILSYPIFRPQLDEPVDGLIYIACVALGFSVIENFMYVVNNEDPFTLMIMRSLITTPMHISMSIFMGLAFYLLVKYKKGWTVLVISYVYAVLVHDIYDLIAFNELNIDNVFVLLILLPIIWLSNTGALNLLDYSNAVSPFRQSLKFFIDNCKNPKIEEGLECLNCGNNKPKPTYKIGKIIVQKCPGCDKYVAIGSSINRIIHRFGSTFTGIFTNTKYPGITYIDIDGTNTNNGYSTVVEGSCFSKKRNLACFDLEQCNEDLEKLTNGRIDRMPNFVHDLLAPKIDK